MKRLWYWVKRLFGWKPPPKAYLIDIEYIQFWYHKGRKPKEEE